jgi:hypothetical protein
MKQIASALVKAQKGFAPALKTTANPFYKSRYADLSACIEAVIDALNSNGIMLMQQTSESDTGVTVETVFLHESGEMLNCGKLHVPAGKQDPQGYGSALTYARRYSLMAACGIAPEDDDGNAASKPTKGKGAITPSGSCADELTDDERTLVYDSVREAVAIYRETGEIEKVDRYLRFESGLTQDMLAAVPYFLGAAKTEDGKKLSTAWTKYTKAHPTAEELINTP